MADVMSFSFENEGNGFGNGEISPQGEGFGDNTAQGMIIDAGTGDDDTFSGLDPNFDTFGTAPTYPSLLSEENLFGSESGYTPFGASSSDSGQHTYTPLGLSHLPLHPTSSDGDGWQKRLDSLVDAYKAQTRDFHRLVATQKLLTGVDPLTGQAVELRSTTTRPQSAPVSALTVPGIKPALLAIFLKFLDENPKPTKKDLKQLLPRVNMSEKETIDALKKVRKAKQDQQKRGIKLPEVKAEESPESRKEAILNQQLLDIVDRQGGVSEPQKMIKLRKLMADEKSPDTQSLLLNIISNSRRVDLKKVFLDNDGLVVLKAWLIQGVKEKNMPLVRQVLKVTYTLPMTVETLQKSGMGKLIKKLENHPTEAVKKWAVRIMNSWKDVVLNASKKVEGSPVKKEAEERTERTRLEKKEKEQVSPSGARGVKRPREAAPAAGVPKPQLKISASEEFDDLIAGPAKPRPGTEKRKLQGLIPEHVNRRRHAVQLIAEDVTTPHPIAKGVVGSYKSRPLSADDIKRAKSSSSSSSSSSSVSPLSPPLASPVTKEPRLSERRDSDPGKRLREDDEEAFPDASEVRSGSFDEGESRPPKRKKKRVSWASDEKLVQVKTYEKYLPSLMGNVPRPTGSFGAMIQLERQREREIAEQQRQHEEEEWKERFEKMTATMPWKAPQLLYMSPEYKVAMGEKSKEADIQRERQSKILGEYYSREEDIPPTPTEPTEPQEEYDDASVTLIPLDEMYIPPPQQQQQQQQQQQLPPQLQQQAQLQPQPTLSAPPMGQQAYGAPVGMMGHPPSMPMGGMGQHGMGAPGATGGQGPVNMELALNALLSNPSALGSLLGDNQALSSLLASLPAGAGGGPQAQQAGGQFMGLNNPNINSLAQQQQQPPMGMGPSPSAGMMYNPSQPSAPLPPHLMQQGGYLPPRQTETPYGGMQSGMQGMQMGMGPMGPQGMQPQPYAGGAPYGGPPPQSHGGYPMGGGGYGGGGHDGPGGGRSGHGGGGGHDGGRGGHDGGRGGHDDGRGGRGGSREGGGNWGRDDRKRDRLCSFFNSPQGCRNGESCPFQHVPGVSAKWPHERREERERRR